jgi:phosphoglycerol transferase MdoB-like AlkP superfamily enzyme
LDGRQLLEDDRERVGFDWSRLVSVKPAELGFRFLFGAAIALLAAVVGTIAGPRFGGLFLAFPAVLPATLTLIEKKEGTEKAWADASGGVLGALGLGAFAGTAMVLRWNTAAALLLALLAWTVISAGLYFLFRATGLFLRQDRLVSKSRS